MLMISLQALIMVLTSSILITKVMAVDREIANNERELAVQIGKKNSQIFSRRRTSVKITSTRILAINLTLILVAPNHNNNKSSKSILYSNSNKSRM